MKFKKKLQHFVILILILATAYQIYNFLKQDSLDESIINLCKNMSRKFDDLTDEDESLEYLEHLTLGGETYAYLLDAEDIVLYHPLEQHIGHSISEITGNIFIEPLMNLSAMNNHLLYKYEFGGSDRMTYFYKTRSGSTLAITGLERIIKAH